MPEKSLEEQILEKLSGIEALRVEDTKSHEVIMGKLNTLEAKIDHVSSTSKETHKIVAGNGDPSKGLATRFEVLTGIVSSNRDSVLKHIAEHKIEEEKKEESIWGIAKPVIEKLIVAFLTGGALLGLQEVIK